MTNEEFAQIRNKNLTNIVRCVDSGKLELAMLMVSLQAELSYLYNQFFMDDKLEKIWSNLVESLPDKYHEQEVDNSRVLWYDAFGLGNRGVAYIYIKALNDLGYKILYLTYDGAKKTLGRLKGLLIENNHDIVFLSPKDNIDGYNKIINVIMNWRAAYNFLYTKPDDVSGIAAFQKLPCSMQRFQINLTDHAYWLGVNAFDKCIEFRDFGINVSRKYRKIDGDKIRKLPYYPVVDYEQEFQGFPFNKKNQKVIFAGGSIYKTIDSQNTFYYLIEEMLKYDDEIVFWYAGDKKIDAFKDLENRYRNRVFFTNEREDLMQILQKVDLFINTYPVSGALMLQYAAIAGKVPFTLVHNDDAYGVLLKEANIYYTDIQEMLLAMKMYINNNEYRDEMNNMLNETIISEKDFCVGLQQIIQNKNTKYKINNINYDVKKIQETYRERFAFKDYYKIVSGKRYRKLFPYYKKEILFGKMQRIFKL